MKKLLSFGGFVFIVLNLFLLHGGIVMLAGMMEIHTRRIIKKLDQVQEEITAVSVDPT